MNITAQGEECARTHYNRVSHVGWQALLTFLESSMANAEANQMIVSDAIVPQSELEQVMALDRTSRAVSKQLLEMAGNEAAKAL
ncbi:hypothetical protein KC887_07100, partial [Candidatus Kaiserbacteria bacterium]|nr:hypothetical protein [Candidatus Kaiserbacteria bacterium]